MLPLSTAFIVCEAFGLEAAVDRRFREAPIFYIRCSRAASCSARRLVLLLHQQDSLFEVHVLRAGTAQGALLPLELVLMLVDHQSQARDGCRSPIRPDLQHAIGWVTADRDRNGLAIVYVVQSLFGAFGGGS